MTVEEASIDKVVAFDGETVEVEAWPPFSDEEIISGNPAHKGKVLYRDDLKRISYGVWECPVGKFRVEYGPMSEHIQCVKGEAVVTDLDTGEEVHLTPGVRMIVPSGSTVIWDIKDTFRKVYSVYEPEWDEERYY